MKDIISEYGAAIIGAIGTVIVIGLIITNFMHGGALASTILGFLNGAF